MAISVRMQQSLKHAQQQMQALCMLLEQNFEMELMAEAKSIWHRHRKQYNVVACAAMGMCSITVCGYGEAKRDLVYGAGVGMDRESVVCELYREIGDEFGYGAVPVVRIEITALTGEVVRKTDW